MRIVYAVDLHGDDRMYRELADFVAAENADVLILGGDLCPYSSVGMDQVDFVASTLRAWLSGLARPVYAITGNIEWPVAVAALSDLHDAGLLRLLSLVPVALGPGLSAIGYPFIPPSPFHRHDGERRDLAADRIDLPQPSFMSNLQGERYSVPPGALNSLPSIEEDFATLASLPKESILIAHAPPFGGLLDVTAGGVHAGSRALTLFVERARPLLALHGHIHEAPAVTGQWAEWRGHTLCVNPGRGERLQAVVFDGEDPPGSIRHNLFGNPRSPAGD